jgi:hypothetical protein
MLPRATHPIITVPGWTGSGPGHWQTLWERRDPQIRRVEQADWNNPVVADWVERLDEAVRAAPAPPVLVAHSLGCLTVVHWAAGTRTAQAAGALLVAPPDVESAGAPQPLRSFPPVPVVRLPFPRWSWRAATTRSRPSSARRSGRMRGVRSSRTWGKRVTSTPPRASETGRKAARCSFIAGANQLTAHVRRERCRESPPGSDSSVQAPLAASTYTQEEPCPRRPRTPPHP